MRVININTAKDWRRSDNGQDHILCSIPSRLAFLFLVPKTEQESDYVYKTVPLSVGYPTGACARPAHIARKPLRPVISRLTVRTEYRPKSGYFLTHYVDTLSCGHEVITYKGDERMKRRGCADCLAISAERRAA